MKGLLIAIGQPKKGAPEPPDDKDDAGDDGPGEADDPKEEAAESDEEKLAEKAGITDLDAFKKLVALCMKSGDYSAK